MMVQSLTWYFFKRTYLFAKRHVQASFFAGVLASFEKRISREVQNSLAYAWLDSSVLTERDYKTSWFYDRMGRIWRWLSGVIRCMACCMHKHVEGSFFLRRRGRVSLDLGLALLLGVMLILPHNVWNNLYFVLFVFIFGVWLLLQVAVAENKNISFFRLPISAIVFVLSLFFSAITAAVPADGFRFFLFLLASVLCAIYVGTTLSTKEKLERFVKLLLLSLTVAGLFGILQRMQGLAVNPEFVDVQANQDMPARVYGGFSNPNSFAQLLILFMPFFVPCILFSKKVWERVLFILGLCIVFVALLMTYSRSAWVGFLVSAVLVVCIYDKRLLLPLVLFALLAMPFLPKPVINRIFTIGSLEDSSNAYRLYIWQGCFLMLKDVAVTGVGLGPASFGVVYPAYASPVAVTAPHSHSLFLQLVLELGILGAVAFFVYIAGIIKQAGGAMRYMNRELACYSTAAICALFGIGFVSCAEYIWFYPRVMFAFWLLPGILHAITQLIRKETIERTET